MTTVKTPNAYHNTGDPEKVKMHNFIDCSLGNKLVAAALQATGANIEIHCIDLPNHR